MSVKDFVGTELNVGDRVVHGVGGRYGGLSGPYFVHSFTPKMVRLARNIGGGVSTIVPPSNLAKVAHA